MSIKIISFEPKYAPNFRDLNKAWLEKYFYLESKDIALLEDCKKTIIDTGGYIFFAKYNDEIVGCFSLMRSTAHIFELGKMAVSESYQGLRIGQDLLSYAIDFAKKHKWRKIILYSNTKLSAALHIYRKYGFYEVELEDENPYARSDIKMELYITNLQNSYK